MSWAESNTTTTGKVYSFPHIKSIIPTNHIWNSVYKQFLNASAIKLMCGFNEYLSERYMFTRYINYVFFFFLLLNLSSLLIR